MTRPFKFRVESLGWEIVTTYLFTIYSSFSADFAGGKIL
jgi:hypothetical protein